MTLADCELKRTSWLSYLLTFFMLEEGVKFIKKWDWGNVEETDLVLAERVVRDCRYVGKLTDVARDPTRPCTTPEPVSPVE
ncbi:hypothetical protein N7527_007672 [Penicillium freii]|nr:hypothetical protein N7527_007672 [Penicillium freii]